MDVSPTWISQALNYTGIVLLIIYISGSSMLFYVNMTPDNDTMFHQFVNKFTGER